MYLSISPIIKRIIIVTISAGIVISASGCSRNSSESTASKQPAKVTSNQASKPAPDDKKDNSNEADKAKDSSKAEASPADDTPKLQLSQKGVTLSWVEKGQVRMKASGRESKYDDMAKVASMLDLNAQLYQDGKLSASMKAPKAIANTTTRIVTATGGVTLKSMERNTIVKAAWMKWYAKEQKVIGDGGVKITSSMGTLTGAAFVADTNMRTITIKDSAKGLKF